MIALWGRYWGWWGGWERGVGGVREAGRRRRPDRADLRDDRISDARYPPATMKHTVRIAVITLLRGLLLSIAWSLIALDRTLLLVLRASGWSVRLLARGVSWLLWGICLRTVIVYHGTWFVNSASHTWGYRNYNTPDLSTNLWWVALLAFGEGWHNNHHAYQRSAAHGLRWYEIDLTYWTIRLLGCVGLAKDIVLPKADEMPS